VLTDRFGRNLTYLRVSVTDRCNLRCSYCMPQSHFSWIPQENILRFEEIVEVCRAFAALGISKIRLTGGEPLVRKGICSLAQKLSQIEGVKELCLTTNGVLLREYADELFEAGVHHLNISLDSLSQERFLHITHRDSFEKVWEGITYAIEKGFSPIKINSVVINGVNDIDIPALAKLSITYPIEVRFIEFMPIGENSSWGKDALLVAAEIKNIIEKKVAGLVSVTKRAGSGPASVYKLPGAKGTVGFISPLSNHFCGSCNRIRLTAEGRLRLCLFSDHEIDLRALLRKGVRGKELEEYLKAAVLEKPEGYNSLGKRELGCRRVMSAIGG